MELLGGDHRATCGDIHCPQVGTIDQGLGAWLLLDVVQYVVRLLELHGRFAGVSTEAENLAKKVINSAISQSKSQFFPLSEIHIQLLAGPRVIFGINERLAQIDRA